MGDLTVLKVVTMFEPEAKSCYQGQQKDVKTSCYVRPAWTHNGSVRSDLPLVVIGKKRKRVIETIGAGQLFCVGKIYLKTYDRTIRIRSTSAPPLTCN